MHIRAGTIALIAYAGVAFAQIDQERFIKAQRDQEDRLWAHRSGLPAAQIRNIRISRGITDSTAGYQIRNLDASSLKARDHILLVEERKGCTRITVLRPNAEGFSEIWSLTTVPVQAWRVSDDKTPGSQWICSNFGRSAKAHVTAEGRLAVDISILSDPSMTIAPADTYVFEWNGTTYQLVNDERP